MILLSRENFIYNIKALRSLVPTQKVGLVVKSNAYGHGALAVAQCAQENSLVDYILTFSASEGLALRKAGIVLPILALGYCDITFSECVDHAIEIALIDTIMLEAIEQELQNSGKSVSVHLKVDTGLGRLGYAERSDIQKLLALVERSSVVKLVGLFSHVSDNRLSNQAYTKLQMKRFLHVCTLAKNVAIHNNICIHLFSSGSLFFVQDLQKACEQEGLYCGQMVRLGSGAYGFYKSEEHAQRLFSHGVYLKPIATWVTRAVHVKTIASGECVGYDCQFRACKSMRLALIPQGYADGYPRISSEQRFVLVAGKKAPLVGSVCMNMVACDVTHISDFSLQSEIVLVGGDGQCSCMLMGPGCALLPWELTTRFSASMPRRWIV